MRSSPRSRSDSGPMRDAVPPRTVRPAGSPPQATRRPGACRPHRQAASSAAHEHRPEENSRCVTSLTRVGRPPPGRGNVPPRPPLVADAPPPPRPHRPVDHARRSSAPRTSWPDRCVPPTARRLPVWSLAGPSRYARSSGFVRRGSSVDRRRVPPRGCRGWSRGSASHRSRACTLDSPARGSPICGSPGQTQGATPHLKGGSRDGPA